MHAKHDSVRLISMDIYNIYIYIVDQTCEAGGGGEEEEEDG